MGKDTLNRTKIIKEDGRYLIYYTFGEDDEQTASEIRPPEQARRPSKSNARDAGQQDDRGRRAR